MFRISLFLTLFFFARVGRCESFTLESAVAYAISHNPDLAAARLSIAEAEGRATQSGRLANPELEAEAKPNVRGREYSFGLGFVQKFPLTNRLRLEKAVTRAKVAAAAAELGAAERILATSVRMVGVKMLTLQDTKALKEKQIANSRELAESAARIAEKGEGSVLEVTQFELEAQQLELDLLQLEYERAALVGESRPILGIAASSPVEFTGGLPAVSVSSGASPDVTARPDYQGAVARMESARQEIAVAKANKWEDLSIGLMAEAERAEDAPNGLENDQFIGIRFSLPLPLWNKNEGRIAEAEAAAERRALEAEALAAKVSAEAAAALDAMNAARRILAETESTLLPKAREIEEKIAAFYKQAQPGSQLADVLRSRERRLALEQARLDALRSYHLARIRFEAAMGR
jgi:cobalt-zinc-cadmium efflux system outer membrane protein